MITWNCSRGGCESAVAMHRSVDGVFDVPHGWMKLSHSNTFHVFCSWACLTAFAAMWGQVEEVPSA